MASTFSRHPGLLGQASPTERETLLIAQWNPHAAGSLPSLTLDRSFEQQAERTPDRVAIQFGRDGMTYRELERRSNQLAHILMRHGARPDSLVAICFERSLEMIVSMLATLKAGAGYLPIDPSYPPERIRMTLEDANPLVILTQDALAAPLREVAVPIISVDTSQDLIAKQDATKPVSAVRPENLAYVIYTSGSTGKPKGVMVTHRNVGRLLKATERWFDFNSSDVWTLFHSSAFDFSVWEIWGCLLTGGRLVGVPYWITRSPQDFYNLLAEERVTVLNQTPAAFYQIINVEESGLVKPLALRYVILGGEALTFVNLRQWLERHGDQQPQLVNMYGITETTVHVTYRPVTVKDSQSEARSLIGTPISDLRLYLLDSQRRPVPTGEVGEIYVGGDGVSRGYLNRPELTSERFVFDPFAGEPGAVMYKSGDLARFLDHGDIEYLGRADMQVKVRGFRIELGEVEAALAEHSAVHQVVVVALREESGESRLVAYFVGDHATKAADLREFLRSKLPEYMIPYAYVALDALPLTINGKIDRAALPPPPLASATRQSGGADFVAPRSPDEKTMAGIWAEVLRRERVGIDDNLLELGADSLHVFQIAARARGVGLAVTPRQILVHRTIRGIASGLATSTETKNKVSTLKSFMRLRAGS